MIDMGPIAQLIGLESLDLAGWDGVKALPSLKALEHLRDLNLFGWRDLSDLTPLAFLTNLQVLNLSGCECITDLGPLRALKSLHTLVLVGVDNIVDFDPLVGLELSRIFAGRRLVDRLPPNLKSKAEVPEVPSYLGSERIVWAARHLGSI
jgi:hypothetical protein